MARLYKAMCAGSHKNSRQKRTNAPYPSHSLHFLYFPSLHKAPNNHPNADEHKRNAEPLPHVEGHVFLEFHLDVFQELDADARAKDDDEEGAEHQARLLVAKVTFVVHPQEDAHGHETEEGFIESGGVAGEPFTRWTGCVPSSTGRVVIDGAAELLCAAQEDEAPRQGSGRAVNLMVHHVADANKRPDEAHRHHDAVEMRSRIQM